VTKPSKNNQLIFNSSFNQLISPLFNPNKAFFRYFWWYFSQTKN